MFLFSDVKIFLCVDVGVGGVLLDEFAAWSYILAHEH
jgi:hypothetical protein